MMRKNILNILCALLILIVSCDDTNENLVGQRGEAVSPNIESITSSFFDLSDLDNAFVEFVVNAEFPSEVSKVYIKVDYNGNSIELEPYTSLPATVRLTASEVTAALGVNMDNLELGDVFSFQVLVENLNGLKTLSNVVINATVACQSTLDGTYSCVANGTSTDSGPGADENPAVDFVSTITLTSGDVNGEYTISDFSGGLFTLWYDIYGLSGDYPGKIKDVCGDLSYISTKGPFGSPISGTGSVDDETGVITLTGLADAWGDTWTLVLTPQ